jgi:DNA-binding transcriptional LysR family regulator
MDRLDELLVLATILDTGSLAGAARRLRRSPPAVTRSLAALEERVGAVLVQRTTRRLTPTQSGQRLATRARELLADYEQAVVGVKESKDAPLHGLLRITAPSLFGRLHVAPIVSRFLHSNPDVRVELALSNHNLNLVEGGFDVAVRIGRLAESGLIARRVGRVYAVHAASPDYIARHGRPRAPRDLAKHDIIFVSQPRAVVNWRFRISGRQRVVRLSPRFMVSDVDVALSVARAGGGIVRCLSYQVADDFASGTLVRLLREFETPATPVHLVAPTGRRMPRVLRAFLDIAAPTLAALPVLHN